MTTKTADKTAPETEPEIAADKTAPETEPEIAAERPAPGQKAILANAIMAADQFRNNWRCIPAVNATLDDLLRPDYWTHVAHKLRRGDLVEVFPEGEAYYAQLIVRSSGNGWANLEPLFLRQFETEASTKTTLTTVVEWGGAVDKYRVIRLSDRYALSVGHNTQGAAVAWQLAHEKAVG
jgi:hypothetical protein